MSKQQTNAFAPHHFAPSPWRIRLGKIPAIIMLVTVLATAALVHFSWQHAFHKSVYDLTLRISNRITIEIAHEVRLLLGAASTKVLFIHKLLTEGLVDLADTKAQEVLFLSTLQSNPTFSWVTLGHPNGNFFGTQRLSLEKLRSVNRIWNPAIKRAKSVDRFFQQEGETVSFTHTTTAEVRYFAPARTWYQDAVRSNRRVWTDVYIYASSQKPGIDVAVPLEKEGKIVGVIAVGMELDQISSYLGSISVGKSGVTFIINRASELIAYQDVTEVVVTDNVGGKLKLGQLSNARAPLLRVAAAVHKQWDLSKIQTIHTDVEMVDSVEYLVTLSPSVNSDWLIGTVIPMREFVSEVDGIQNHLLLLIGVAVFLLSGLTLLWVRTFLVRPLVATTELVTRIGQGGTWEANNAPPSPIVEIHLLILAMQRMGWDLLEMRNREREQAETRLNQERSLAQLSLEMRETEESETACMVGLVFLIRVLDAQIGAVYLLEEGGLLRLNAQYALSPDHLSAEMRVAESWLGAVILEKRVKMLAHFPNNSFVIRAGLLDIMPNTLMALPLLQNGQAYGVLIIGSIHPLTDIDINFAQQVAETMTAAIVGIQSIVRNRALLEETLRQKEALSQSQQELNETIEQLKRTSEYKSQFLANMSHEIRTPINAVIGMSYLTLRTRLTDQQHDYISKVHTSAQTLLGIINDILDFSKIEAGEMELEAIPFALDEILDNMANMVCLKAEAKGLHLLVARAPQVSNFLMGDPLRLGQILTNLANNAVKFTEKGDVIVSIEPLREENNRVQLRFNVEDSGIGLTQEQIGKLFNPFSQADTSTTRKYGGTGLGLSICKHLVERMEGAIGVESRMGEGSIFYFTAWFGRQPIPQAASPLLDAEFLNMRVLVVDDHTRSRQIFSDIVASFSWRCDTADSGRTAMAAIEKTMADPQAEPYRLAIIHWKMAELDGVMLSRQIKEHPGLAHPPRILLVTPYNREEVIPKTERSVLDGFLSTPVNPSQLLSAIMTTFGKNMAERRNRKLDPPQNTEAAQKIVGAKVLVADDNAINQQVATALLEGHGLVVTVVSNGQEAVAAVGRDSFDLVLMDIQMPEMDGFQATQAIRRNPHGKTLPIVALTAHAMAGDREKSLHAGMNDHLTKPIDPDKLFAILVQWIPPKDREAPALASTPSTPQAPDMLPDRLPGIDLATGLKQVGGDRRLLKKLLLEFYKDYQQIVTILRTGLAEENLEEPVRLLHTVKGIAGSLGAHKLHHASRGLERLLKAGQLEEAAPALVQFEQAVTYVFQGIAPLQTITDAPATPIQQGDPASLDVEQLQPLVQELAALLRVGHASAEERLQELIHPLGNTVHAPTCQRIQRLLEEYEFQAALQALAELAHLLEIDIVMEAS